MDVDIEVCCIFVFDIICVYAFVKKKLFLGIKI